MPAPSVFANENGLADENGLANENALALKKELADENGLTVDNELSGDNGLAEQRADKARRAASGRGGWSSQGVEDGAGHWCRARASCLRTGRRDETHAEFRLLYASHRRVRRLTVGGERGGSAWARSSEAEAVVRCASARPASGTDVDGKELRADVHGRPVRKRERRWAQRTREGSLMGRRQRCSRVERGAEAVTDAGR